MGRFNISIRVSITLLWLFSIALYSTENAIAQNEAAPLSHTAIQRQQKLKFRPSPWFEEQIAEQWIEPNVRVFFNAPSKVEPHRPLHLIVYATPNGNTIEQTLGSAMAPGLDWHFDIQHIAAQTRRLRKVSPDENIVLACVEAEGLSWPAWRAQHPNNAVLLRALVESFSESLKEQFPLSQPVRVTLSGHSGGGSFLFGFLNSSETIPESIDRIAFLDANYAYSDTPERHGNKLLAWLKSAPTKHLVVLAYDDRNITLNGKNVVGPTGGTFRASQRMISRFQKELALTESQKDSVATYSGLEGRLLFQIHLNPENKILHTALVGEMNGFLEALTTDTPQAAKWGAFSAKRAYAQWIQPAPVIPARPADALGGQDFLTRIADMTSEAREAAIAQEILRGNVPEFLRVFQNVTVKAKDNAGQEHTAIYQVMPDYLAVGSNGDFVRLPMRPQTAQLIADAFNCTLPTRKKVNDIHQQAQVKLEPRPLTEAREAVTTFGEHNALIEKQRTGQPLGLLLSGIKKDVVITNLLSKRPNRVAIYGWHKLDGTPIQPLSTVHRDSYVDYSHGVRLIKRMVIINGKTRELGLALHSEQFHILFSDEGPIESMAY
ncbi:MAG TPA: hypothetical protein VGB77_01600 [Abditibacteriaceae bacterium]|jgi:hypothetical protein